MDTDKKQFYSDTDDDYVYTGHGRYPYQYIPRKFLDEQNDESSA
jgi:hypothetical protein